MEPTTTRTTTTTADLNRNLLRAQLIRERAALLDLFESFRHGWIDHAPVLTQLGHVAELELRFRAANRGEML